MSSRFTMAAHVLAMLAHSEQEHRGPVTSETMAASIRTNPVVVRRIVAELVHAGLVESRRGAGGGVSLARRPTDISLLDVYRAVEERVAAFDRHAGGPNPECPIGPHVAAFLEGVFGRAQTALEGSLERVTLQRMFEDLQVRVRSEREAAAGEA